MNYEILTHQLDFDNVPTHKDVKELADKISFYSGYKIVDEEPRSRVVLLMKDNSNDRLLNF